MSLQKFEMNCQEIRENNQSIEIEGEKGTTKQLFMSYLEGDFKSFTSIIKLAVTVIPWDQVQSAVKWKPYLELEFCKNMIEGVKIVNPQQNPNINNFINLLAQRNNYSRLYLELLCIMISHNTDTVENFVFIENRIYTFNSEITTFLKMLDVMRKNCRGEKDQRFKLFIAILIESMTLAIGTSSGTLIYQAALRLCEFNLEKSIIKQIVDCVLCEIKSQPYLATVYTSEIIKLYEILILFKHTEIAESLFNQKDLQPLRKIKETSISPKLMCQLVEFCNNISIKKIDDYLDEITTCVQFNPDIFVNLFGEIAAKSSDILLNHFRNFLSELKKMGRLVDNTTDSKKRILADLSLTIVIALLKSKCLNEAEINDIIGDFVLIQDREHNIKMLNQLIVQLDVNMFSTISLSFVEKFLQKIKIASVKIDYNFNENEDRYRLIRFLEAMKTQLAYLSDNLIVNIISAIEPNLEMLASRDINISILMLATKTTIKLPYRILSGSITYFINQAYDDVLGVSFQDILNSVKIDPQLHAKNTITTPAIPYVLETICNDSLEEYNEFYKLYQNTAEEAHVPFNILVMTNALKIINLYQLMGKNCFLFLKELTKISQMAVINFFAGFKSFEDEFLPMFHDFYKKTIVKESWMTQEILLCKLGVVASTYGVDITAKQLLKLKNDLDDVSAVEANNVLDRIISKYYAKKFKIKLKADLQIFQDFYRVFLVANNRADINHRLSFPQFIHDHELKISNLYQVLGVNAFIFLKGFIATSVITLNRFMASYKIVIHPEFIPYVKLFYERMLNASHQERESFFRIMNEIAQFHQEVYISEQETVLFDNMNHDTTSINSLSQEIIQQLENLSKLTLNNKMDAKNILIKLKLLLSIFYCHYLKLPVNQDSINRLVNKFQGQQLQQLFEGRRAMQANAYEEVFDELIKLDLLKQQSFDDFILNDKQSSMVGKKLAKHNLEILQCFKQSGINTDLLLNYNRFVSFVDNTNSTDSLINILFTLWNDVAQLFSKTQVLINKKDNNSDNKLLELYNLINNFRTQVLKANSNKDILQADLKALQQILQIGQLTCLTKIADKLKEIKVYQIPGNTLTQDERYLVEAGNHFTDRLAILHKEINNNGNSKKKTHLKNSKRYRAEIWDKSRYDTMFLGNKVKCCLSTDGAHHYAIHQRRMDIAMQIPVVIDEDTDEPVALIWGYFAKDKQTPKGIVFVANFIEMLAGIAMKQESRKILLQQLLDFAAKYAKDIGAKEFIVRYLKYGVIPDDDLKNFKDLNIKIEKVGGYFQLNEDNENGVSDFYYLDSVSDTKFHRFPMEQLCTDVKDSKSEMQIAFISSASFFSSTTKGTVVNDAVMAKQHKPALGS